MIAASLPKLKWVGQCCKGAVWGELLAMAPFKLEASKQVPKASMRAGRRRAEVTEVSKPCNRCCLLCWTSFFMELYTHRQKLLMPLQTCWWARVR